MNNQPIFPCECGKTPKLARDKSSDMIWPYYITCECGYRGKDSFTDTVAIHNWNENRRVNGGEILCLKCNSIDTYQTPRNLAIYECGNCSHQWEVK